MGYTRGAMQLRAWRPLMLALGAAFLPACQAFSSGLGLRLPGLALRAEKCVRHPRVSLRHHQWTMGAETEQHKRRHMLSVLASIILVAAPLEQPAYASTAVAQHATGVLAPAKSAVLSSVPWAAASAEVTHERTSVPADARRILSWSYSEFLDAVEQKQVLKATFSPDCRRILALTVDGHNYEVNAQLEDHTLMETLTVNNVDVIILEQFKEDPRTAIVKSVLFFSIFLFINGLTLFMQGLFANGSSGAKTPSSTDNNSTRVTFDDVMGVDGAKEEL